ncbi:MAG: ATPase ATP-binding domain-containing protein [Rhodospirillaceae bacterium]|nr:MAG: ATPase ATP-binding domain-containing protein [Rhodospirillaceae bacterium]
MSKINLSQDISFCKGPVDIAELASAELASAVLARHRPAMEAKRLVLSISLPGPLTIYADAESVTDALENVFGNAAKFTPDGGTVAVTLRDEGCWARLDVVNTADALAEEELERIFHPFHRGERKSAEGAGLGLAIARKAMERNEGWISASNMDQGLSFSIRLPLCDLRGSGE